MNVAALIWRRPKAGDAAKIKKISGRYFVGVTDWKKIVGIGIGAGGIFETRSFFGGYL